MNLILFAPSDYAGAGELRLTDARARQIISVHRSSIGDTVRIGQLQGRTGHGIITALDQTGVKLQIQRLDIPPPPKLPLTVILALPRPKVLRRVLRSLTELGAKSIVLLHACKVEKSYWQSPLLTAEKLHAYLVDGLMQCGDTIPPELTIRRQFDPFIKDELSALAADTRKLVAHPGAGPGCPAALPAPCTLAIGPEGGFMPAELEKFQQAGFARISLGPRILRVETAVSALVGRLCAPR